MSRYFVSPKKVTLEVIPSSQLFWWEVVEVFEGRVISYLGKFRSEEAGLDYINKYLLV